MMDDEWVMMGDTDDDARSIRSLKVAGPVRNRSFRLYFQYCSPLFYFLLYVLTPEKVKKVPEEDTSRRTQKHTTRE